MRSQDKGRNRAVLQYVIVEFPKKTVEGLQTQPTKYDMKNS